MTLTSVADTFLFRPLGFADAVGQPLLVVHGDADESVPLDHGRWIFDRAKGPKEMHVLPGAPHCCWETLHEPAGIPPEHRMAAQLAGMIRRVRRHHAPC